MLSIFAYLVPTRGFGSKSVTIFFCRTVIEAYFITLLDDTGLDVPYKVELGRNMLGPITELSDVQYLVQY